MLRHGRRKRSARGQSQSGDEEQSNDKIEMQNHGPSEAEAMREQTTAETNTVYRNLYVLLTVMTAVMFTINVIQIGLLYKMRSWQWIVLFPSIVFALFLIAMVAYIWYERVKFFKLKSYAPVPSHSGEVHDRTDEKSSSGEVKWPNRSMRIGILLTMIFNIILCEFVYLNTYAIPEYERLSWHESFHTKHSLSVPSMAIIQHPNLDGNADLESDEQSLKSLCTQKRENDKFGNKDCFSDFTTFQVNEEDSSEVIQYVKFNGSTYKELEMNENLLLFYKWNLQQDLQRPIASIAVFDSRFLEPSNFARAYRCGIIQPIIFPARGRSQVNIERIQISDSLNAMNRQNISAQNNATHDCNLPIFHKYNTYDVRITPLGVTNSEGCPYNETTGSCNGEVNIVYTTLTSTERTSKRGKDWKTMLTDEGGINGGLMFITWFFGIFPV